MDQDQLDGERDKLDQVKRCDGCGEKQDHLYDFHFKYGLYYLALPHQQSQKAPKQ
jgi:hypothetical protein